MKVYRNLSTKPNIVGDHHGVLNPRNLKQVKNHQAKVRQEKKLGKDDIYNLILLAHHLDGFVSDITVYPDLHTIFVLFVVLPEIMDTFIELLQSNVGALLSALCMTQPLILAISTCHHLFSDTYCLKGPHGYP